MKCWYLYGAICERHGICEGCPTYDQWCEERDKAEKELMKSDKARTETE